MIRLKVPQWNLAAWIVLCSMFLMAFITRNIVAVLIALCLLIQAPTVFSESSHISASRSEFKWLMLYLASFLVSAVFAVDVLTTGREFLIECLIYAWLIVVFVSANKYGCQHELLSVYVVSCVILSMLFIGYNLLGIPVLSFVENIELVKTWNHFCYYIGAAAVVVFLRFLNDHKIYHILWFLIIILAINVATGRGATVAIVVACTICYLEMSRGSKKRKILMVLGIIVFIVGYQYFSTYVSQVMKIFDPTSTFSNRERFTMWQGCFEMFRDHPFGVGMGNWADMYNAHYKRSSLSYPHAHNVFIQTLCELGFIGGISFIGLLGNSILATRHKYLRTGSAVAIVIHGVMLYSAIDFMFNNPINNSKPLILFFSVLGAGYSECIKNNY